jgi:hypothetical protein
VSTDGVLFFAGREGKPVGLDEVVDRDLDRAALRIDPVDVLLLLFLLGLEALVVGHDPVSRVGETDRAVGGDDHVVRRVQLLAVVAVGDDGDRAVELGTRDPPGAVLAGDEAVDAVVVLPFEFIDGARNTSGCRRPTDA